MDFFRCTDMNLLANFSSPDAIQRKIASQFQARRLMQNLTQEALSKKSGVSLGTIRRFEQTGDISMKHLVLLAMYLNIVQEMEGLFKVQLIQDLYVKTPKLRKRAR